MEDSTEADIFYSEFQLRGKKFSDREGSLCTQEGFASSNGVGKALDFFGVKPHRFWGVSYMGKVCTCV